MNTKIFLNLLIFLTILSCKTLKFTDNKEPVNNNITIEFEWIENEINGKLYDKSAISIDFSLVDNKQKLNLQFDTGSQQSFVSAEMFDLILEKYPKLISKVDTLKYDETNSDILLKDLAIISNDQTFRLNLYKGESENQDSEQDNTIISGTLGADFCADKIVIINYPERKLIFESKIPDSWYKYTVESKSMYGKLNIPIEIESEKKYVLFDTGASIFQLATTPNGYKSFFGNLDFTEEIEVPSFGSMLNFKGKSSQDNIIIAGKTITKPFIHYSDNPNVVAFLEESELFGVTGNALFLNDIVLIDYINNKFGLIEKTIFNNLYKK